MTRPILNAAWTHPLLSREYMLDCLNRQLERGGFRQSIYDGWAEVSVGSRIYAGGLCGNALQIARTALDDAGLLPRQITAYPTLFGIPSTVAHLANTLFEKMPAAFCGNFAVQFHHQVAQDANLSEVSKIVASRVIREVIVPILDNRGLAELQRPLALLADGISTSWGVDGGQVTTTPTQITDEAIAIADAIFSTLKKEEGKQVKEGVRLLAYGIRRGLYTDDTSAFSSLWHATARLAGTAATATTIAVQTAAILCHECSCAPSPEIDEVPSMALHP